MTPLTRKQIAWRAAQDIAEGQYVNLGIGLPTLVSDYVPPQREVVLHSENGILGMGGAPKPGEEDRDLINAGKGLTTLRPGGAFFHHNDSFLMIRGGHIDLSVLGAYEVSETGDLANWATNSEKLAPGVGGAMDLAAGAKEVRVLMEHNAKDGSPRLRKACTLPLTAARCVKRVYTSLAVLDVTRDGFLVREMVEGLDLDGLQKLTEAKLSLANDWKRLSPPGL
ncbi:MAG TPA: 3-oxoacid CoA-transferase subunit B [Stellaceae bacterium]|nr:3-oxoacid CoA-transferase subunit B [Stellaceae bacterium]